MYKAPASIINHPGVQECVSAEASGLEGYKHDVFLKEGWAFSEGRNAGCRGCAFNSVAEFKLANPVQK